MPHIIESGFPRSALAGVAMILLACAPALAHEHPGPAVVPEAERAAGAAKAFSGPTENRGIAKIEPVAAIDLASEFPELTGRQFRARVITLDPGAVVAVHEHQQRPGIAYILEGEVVETRNDADAPIIRGVGAVAIERTGVVHFWENRTDRQARALIVDIVPR
ncbi:MAG: cupin domain-containing protein [Planctomycetes bacterium]|nr:cupin domain-containing protein [Planctomycetota bacterium]